ncbi:hypothetical protein J4226_02065 [Candidatus Pacearchaeota archaeon]|nr:hypothetical protein [Candidatus Pacearchaeota archaeon]
MKKDKTRKVEKIKASLKQRAAAKKNIKKAQAKWKSMTHRQHALAQPEGRARKKPGMGGKGKFYRVVVRPKSEFVSFKTHDIGDKGHVERIAGKRSSGSWATQAWLVDKKEAHMATNGYLVGDSEDVRSVFAKLRRKPRHLKGDIFEAGPGVNVPERLKPTPAIKKARTKNIKKAQAARRK